MKPETAGEREALLPCPFCGGPVELEQPAPTYDRYLGERNWWGVVCRNTMNRGGTCAIQQRPSASKEATIDRWNMRAQAVALAPSNAPPALAVEMQRLVKAFDRVKDNLWHWMGDADRRLSEERILSAKAALASREPLNAPYASNAIPGDQGDLTSASMEKRLSKAQESGWNMALRDAAATAMRWGDSHEPHISVNARNAASKIARAVLSLSTGAWGSDKPEKSDSKRGLDHAAGQRGLSVEEALARTTRGNTK